MSAEDLAARGAMCLRPAMQVPLAGGRGAWICSGAASAMAVLALARKGAALMGVPGARRAMIRHHPGCFMRDLADPVALLDAHAEELYANWRGLLALCLWGDRGDIDPQTAATVLRADGAVSQSMALWPKTRCGRCTR